MKRSRSPGPSMADIVASTTRVAPGQKLGADEAPDARQIDIDGRVITVTAELTPAEASRVAAESRLVIWDSCGCGGGCGFDIWQGSRVVPLLEAGDPVVVDGSLWSARDEAGNEGVFVDQAVEWGPLS